MQPHRFLNPFGALYGLIVKFRNKCYDKGWFKSSETPKFSICVGNLSVGGTGKTPMIEYLIELLLKEEENIAVLSRGYKRTSKGFLELKDDITVLEGGDEPFQIARKFKKVKVFVDENRVEGVNLILDTYPQTNVFLLDDAFQHRKIKANLNILLTRFDKLYVDDYYLPAGYLRDHKSRAKDADVVIVTKCPAGFNNADKKAIEQKLKLNSNQQLFFSGLTYNTPKLLFENSKPVHFEKSNCILVTGIAHPEPFINYLSEKHNVLEHYSYADHYGFKFSDIAQWKNELLGYENPIIITTEKDAVRLLDFKKELAGINVFFIPVKMKFIDDKNKFDSLIYSQLQVDIKK
jgi:tetraacyldisaccharide 4'-kinase